MRIPSSGQAIPQVSAIPSTQVSSGNIPLSTAETIPKSNPAAFQPKTSSSAPTGEQMAADVNQAIQNRAVNPEHVANAQQLLNNLGSGTHSANEIKQLFRERIFPGIRQGLQHMQGSVNEANCNHGAAMTMAALQELGIEGAELYEAHNHVMVKVPTADGPVILDATIAQFFKDGTDVDNQLQQEGFVGTEAELRQLLQNNVEHWSFNPPCDIPEIILNVYRGTASAEEMQDLQQSLSGEQSPEAARQFAENFINELLDMGPYHAMFGEPALPLDNPESMTSNAQRYLDFFNGIKPTVGGRGRDMTDESRQAHQTLLNHLF